MQEKDKSVVEKFILNCSDIEELLDSYLDEEISYGLKSRFDKHLEKCPECASLVSDCANIKSLAKTLIDHKIPSDISARLRAVLKQKVGHNNEESLKQKRHLSLIKD